MEPTTLAVDAKRTPSSALQALAAEAKADFPLLLIVAAYVGAVALVCWALNRPEFYHPMIYMRAWLWMLGWGAGIYLVFYDIPMGLLANPRRPFHSLARRLARHANPRLVAGAVLFLAAGLFTGAFTSMKSLLNDLVPFHADRLLAEVDAVLHLGIDPWRLLQPILGHHAVTRTIQNLYLSGWGMMLIGGTAVVAFSPKLAHLRKRFYLTYFAAWIVLGNILAGAFMSGGPVYFGHLTGDEARFAEQIQYLAFSENMPGSSVRLQNFLWNLYVQGKVYIGTGISAFPSLHIAMVTLFTLTAFEVDRRLGWLVGAFAATIFVGSVHLAWHYAIDGYVSAAFVCAVWFSLKRWSLRQAA